MKSNFLLVLCGLVMLVVFAGCGGLGGEPRIIATFPPPTSIPVETSIPSSPPDIALGAQIYAQRCTECHGEDGSGNGTLVQSGQVPYPGNFRDPASARAQTPQAWYSTITNGRIENLMPPWRDALTEEQRWAVAMYTYTLHSSPEQLALGAEVYRLECENCHGVTGLGDGPDANDANRPPRSLADQNEMVTLSDDTLHLITAEGVGEAMPAYQDILSAEQLDAVVAYSRTFSLASAESVGMVVQAPLPESTESNTAPAQAVETTPEASRATFLGDTLTVVGTISNGTSGGLVPSDVPVTLTILQVDATTEQVLSSEQRQTSADAAGNYRFENVPFAADRIYAVVAVYLDRNFIGQPLDSIDVATGTATIPITIYELTDDTSVITITSMEMQITGVAPGRLQIVHQITFRNNSDRMFLSDFGGALEQPASVAMTLPPGAVGLSLAVENRYIYLEEQGFLIDRNPVLPGDHVVQFAYGLPYNDLGAIIEFESFYPFIGDLNLYLAPSTLSARGESVVPREIEQIEGQVAYTGFTQPYGDQEPQDVRFELVGSSGTGVQEFVQNTSGVVAGEALLPIVMIIAGVLLLGFGGVLYHRQRRSTRPKGSSDKDRMINALIRQIAELDEQHERGQLNHDVYQRRRIQLKERLAQLMDRPDDE